MSAQEKCLLEQIILIAKDIDYNIYDVHFQESTKAQDSPCLTDIKDTFMKFQAFEKEFFLTDVTKKVSYPVWCCYLLKYLHLLDELFPPLYVRKFQEEIKQIFLDKTDKNLKTIYNMEYRTIKNEKKDIE